jgi:hypothetical protein
MTSYGTDTDADKGDTGSPGWIAIAALCGAGSVLSVRLAAPTTLDDLLWTFLLFFVLPGLPILVLGALCRWMGIAAALAIPFVWLSITRDSSDSLFIWFVPLLALVLILSAARICPGLRQAMTATAIVLALGALLWPAPKNPRSDTRVVVIGWDGGTWDLLDPLLAEGRMPSLARLAEGSHRAKLRTLDTMLSPQIWSTMATGVRPEVHGMLDFAYRQENFKVGRIWDRLKMEGRTFGVHGWYFIWPPDPGIEDRDFIVPGRYAPDSQVHPSKYEFYREVESWAKTGERRGFRTGLRAYISAGLRAWRHGIRLSTLRMGAAEVLGRKLTERRELDDHWRARRVSVALQGDLFSELLRTRSPEFGAVLFTQVDHVSHKYWKYMFPYEFPNTDPAEAETYGDVINRIYAECDVALGKIMDAVPEDTEFMIVSDHGFQSLHMTHAQRHCRIRTLDIVETLGMDDKLFGTNVDNEVYLRATAPELEDRRRLIAQIEPVLRDVHVIGEDAPLLDVEREGEVLHLSLAPRPAVPEDAKVLFDGVEYPFGRIVRARREAFNTGTHHPDGIYMLSGPSAAHAVDADSLHVLDVAPTLAALLRLPISPLWTGRPAIEGVSIAELGVAEYPPPSEPKPPPTHIDEDLKKRLKALGYLE